MDALCKLCRMCNVNTVKGPCPGFWPGFLFDYELRTGGGVRHLGKRTGYGQSSAVGVFEGGVA